MHVLHGDAHPLGPALQPWTLRIALFHLPSERAVAEAAVCVLYDIPQNARNNHMWPILCCNSDD